MPTSDIDNTAHLGKKGWIFQAAPKYFDLPTALDQIRIFRWRVNQFKGDIHAGDDVFLWLAGSDGGMVARGTILAEPQIMGDAPEETPFVRQPDEGPEKLCVPIEINTVFAHPVTRTTLKDHEVLSSLSILQNPRGTNFSLTAEQAESLNLLCPESAVRAMSLKEAFASFHASSIEQLRVRIRRERAKQLRELLAAPESLSLEAFNREVWVLESATILDGVDIRGKLFDSEILDVEFSKHVASALDAGTLELHGNYVWRPGSSVYGSPLRNATDAEKLVNVHVALRLLNDLALSPFDKVNQIASLPGFGFPTATGLVILRHPDEIAIMNRQTEGAFERLQIEFRDFAEFQAAAARLKTELGCDDFLELDWFLYEINQGMIEVTDAECRQKMLGDLDKLLETNLLSSSVPTETEKEQLVKSRIGQGQFRSEVQKLETSCRVTGVSDAQFLIASHIKPWRSSNNQERLDGNNGLFLSPNIDRLFDQGYLAFGDDGTMLVWSGSDKRTLELLGVPRKVNVGTFSPQKRKYLAYHRQHVFRGAVESDSGSIMPTQLEVKKAVAK